jgi:parvulin-like peptidyl-prolyl isomerase
MRPDITCQSKIDGPLGLVPRRALPPAVAEAVFAAGAGGVAGPFPTGQGFQLLLVEEIRPPELDADTSEAIAAELFDAWLREQMRNVRLDLGWLEGA